jgi:hypothetical protein
MKKHNSTPAFARIHLVKAFLHPLRHVSSVGRIAEYTLSRPILFQSVLILGVIFITLVVKTIGARIKSEVKLLVQFVKEVLRSRPIAR